MEPDLDQQLEELENTVGCGFDQEAQKVAEAIAEKKALEAKVTEEMREKEEYKASVDFRVYYKDIDFEFKKSDDCLFKFVEIKLDSPVLGEWVEKCNRFLQELSGQCVKEGPNMLTTKQQDSQWMKMRLQRVTSSLFGRVCKRKKFDPAESMLKFVQNHLNPYRYQGGIDSLEHGKALESTGVNKYRELKPNCQVKESGMWSNSKFSWLGGSPDGLVYDRDLGKEGLLEVKCPTRGKGVSCQQVFSQKNFYMVKEKDGSFTLDKKTEYYHQIQGCLNILCLDFCDFAVFTDQDMYIQRIERDEKFFDEMIKKLKEFYFRFYLPYNAEQPELEGKTWTYTFLSKEVFQRYYN